MRSTASSLASFSPPLPTRATLSLIGNEPLVSNFPFCLSFSFFVFFLHYLVVSTLLNVCLLLIIGASIVVCHSLGRHIVVLERDFKIFNALLLPMQDLEPLFQPAVTCRGPVFREPP